jgi:hypothetical protein
VKLQDIDISDNDTNVVEQDIFFISTPKDFKYLIYHKSPYRSDIYFKSAHTVAEFFNLKTYDYTLYSYNDKIYDAKHDIDPQFFYYWPLTVDSTSLEFWKTGLFQSIPPKINKKNIRYKIFYPDDDLFSNWTAEMEFNGKTFYWIQTEMSYTYVKTDWTYNKRTVLEDRLYDYIHPDILDTISFMFEELKEGYDRQQAKEDSISLAKLCDSIAQSITNNGYKLTNQIPQDAQQDTLFFMPEWKFPLLSGDTLYSDSINSRFLLIDMWYIACPYCIKAMHELSTIDTLYPESLLKMVSINVSDKDTAKINKVFSTLNLKSDLVYAYRDDRVYDMSKKMGKCRGYPQLYLIDMQTKQIIWHSCGWSAGFTKEIEKIITSGE